MKVILVNGSPHHNGCTYTALQEIEKELNAHGIETEMGQRKIRVSGKSMWVGINHRKPVEEEFFVHNAP